jgi:V-type H+-transporting ATPase subunit C
MDFEEARTQLKRWIRIHYSEAFSCWMHVKMIRTFVEGVLYGLPVDFVTTILFLPNRKHEAKLRSRLEGFFLDVMGGQDLGLAGELTDSSQKREAFYPYVSFSFRPSGGD